MINNTFKKSVSNIILSDEKLLIYSFPQSLRTRQGCPLQLILFKVVLEVLAIGIRQEKEIKVYTLAGKRGEAVSVGRWHNCVENQKESTTTTKLLEQTTIIVL